ncbi:MAG: GUN4 domain-containing protein [Waterburya sp.]
MPKRHWLDLVEYVFIAGSIAGTVATVTTKQGIFAVTPLTIAIGLNVINRQRFNQLSQKQVEHLQQLIQHSQESENKQFSQINNSTLTSDLESVRNQIKQFEKILEHLHNTKAEKETILEINRQTKQLQESQQKIVQLLNSISNDTSSSKESDRLLDPVEKLTSFLNNRNWKEANEQTALILLRLAGKQSHEYLNIEDIKKLPPEELKTLDRLWSTYSNERFSWLVQKQIWEELGGKAGVYEIQMYEKWSKQVGWLVVNQWLFYSELDFTDKALIGHFPAISIKSSSWGSAWCGIETVMLFSKIEKTQYDEDNQTQNLKRDIHEFGNNIEREINGLGDKLKKAFNPFNDLL